MKSRHRAIPAGIFLLDREADMARTRKVSIQFGVVYRGIEKKNGKVVLVKLIGGKDLAFSVIGENRLLHYSEVTELEPVADVLSDTSGV